MPSDSQALIVPPKKARPKRKSMEEKFADIFDGELGLTEIQKAIVKEKYLNPRATGEEIGKIYGLGAPAINWHLRKPQVKKALTRLHLDIFEQVRALQMQAVRTYQRIVTAPGPLSVEENKIQYAASRDLLSAALSAPAVMPSAKRELPEFVSDSE